MHRVPEHYVASTHAVKVVGGGKSLSVLATPEAEIGDGTYKLSEKDLTTLNKVLKEDLTAARGV
jgi:hypothetical protein